jgi:hypothetical protein
MYTASVFVSIALAAALTGSAALDFARYQRVLDVMARAGVPASWLPVLGALKAAGAVGLLVGLGVPAIGIAAAVGVVAFFVGAVLTHVRVRDFTLGNGLPLAVAFGLTALAALVLHLASGRVGS